MRRLLLSLALLLTIGAGCASAQVVFDAKSTAACTNVTSGTGGTSLTICANITVGAGANRALVCGILWDGPESSPSMHWDSAGTNQAMTAITGAVAVNGVAFTAQLFGLIAPTSGTLNLTAAWATSREVAVGCVSYTGVDQTGGATSFPNGTGATGTATTSSVTVTSAVNDAVVAAHSNNAGAASTNNTNVFLSTTQSNQDTGMNRAAGAASVAMTMSLGASSAFASAGTSVHAAAGGGGCTAPPNQLMMLGVGNCKGH